MFRIKFIFKLGYKKSNQPTQEASLEEKNLTLLIPSYPIIWLRRRLGFPLIN